MAGGTAGQEMSDLMPKEPKCPKCASQPLHYGNNVTVSANRAVISVIWCSDCGHIISMQYLGQQQPEIMRPALIKPS
jgi:RNase P subunit RPR2